ncbi:MAG: metallophosphoesterase family protein [Dehalococcoidia bacterium]|nr:metallophosphoesterase family protein [Dehalococcoidia bacterium]
MLVVADVHGNLRALDAVLEDARIGGGFDCVWVLGDLVGYGPNPEECVTRLRGLKARCVAGNHDLGAVGGIDLRKFNHDAAAACAWTAERLSESSVAYLRGLPLRLHVPPFELVHGSPREPVWEYVLSAADAVRVAGYCNDMHCLTGHTHRPVVYSMEAESAPDVSVTSTVELGGRLLINPGAVGQPRDGDPRAAYILYDSEAGNVRFNRVEYDVDGAAAEVLRCGLPQSLAWRLHAGR